MAGADEICVIGGGEIYAGDGIADRLRHACAGDVDGDTRFPPIDPGVMEKVSAEDSPPEKRITTQHGT